jgi:FkbM family methyltransferase
MKVRQVFLEARFHARSRRKKPQKWQIFGQELLLPNTHRLPLLQRLYPNYDTYYAPIFKNIDKSYPGSMLIDIGANVGDTSIGVIKCAPSLRILAVEGNELFINFLTRNIQPFEGRIYLVPKFVSCQSVGSISYEHDGSTGGFIQAESMSETDYNTVGVRELLDFHDSDLIIWKSDTDGLDVPIVMENFDLLNERAGIWWLELDPNMEPTNLASVIELVNAVSATDRHYLLFDNYGHKVSSGLIATDKEEIARKFREIPKTFKVGSQAIRYYDMFIYDLDRYPNLKLISG